MSSCAFVFDTVVTKLESSYAKITNLKKLKVVVAFNGKFIPITASRINVTDFQSKCGTEFLVEPKTLRKTLEKCGMPVTVQYEGCVIGTGQIIFPQSFTDCIEEGMSDLVHWDSCNLHKSGKISGTLEVLCRLVIKCSEEQKKSEIDFNMCNINKSINPQDILFVTGGSQQCSANCEHCANTWETEEGDERLKLDLERYKRLNADNYRTPDTQLYDPPGDCACFELKKMVSHCNQFIDSLVKRSRHTKPPAYKPEEPERTYEPPPASYSSYLPKQQEYKKTDYCRLKPTSSPKCDTRNQFIDPQIKPIRFCSICLTSMSWLPKYAACPKCGNKILPSVQKPKEKTPSVGQILKDYMSKPSTNNDDDTARNENTQKESQQKSRCSCKKGKMCAHCRIRQQCADIFQPEGKDTDASELSSMENCVKLEGSRPHLARVFSELCELYDNESYKEYAKRKIECELPPTGNINTNTNNHHLSFVRKHAIIPSRRPLTEQKRRGKAVHKSCVKRIRPVSRRHGWNWSASQEARKYGWQPGAVLKPIKKLMNFFLYHPPRNTNQGTCKEPIVNSEIEQQPPTLNVRKKNGEIFITLRSTNSDNDQTKPVAFKVVKSDLAVALSEIKSKFKAKGFPRCTCHNTVMMCTCRNSWEKKQLEYALQKECKQRGMESCVDQLVLTDTSESEMEYDFNVSPPPVTGKPPCPPNYRSVNNATQTDRRDQQVPSKYPIKHDPYWRAFECAAGDRITGTAFGAPGEEVFEDGLFGCRGGGLHGANATPGGRPNNLGGWSAYSGRSTRGDGHISSGWYPGGKSFPHFKQDSDAHPIKRKPIPVKMTNRLIKMRELAAKAKLGVLEEAKKKKPLDMQEYLKKHGAFSKPVVGPDGLTNAQRRHLSLLQMSMPPIEHMSRMGGGLSSSGQQCYNPCELQCGYSPYGFYY